ncbi:hypothetical protein D3C86_1500370 [compost metagenome]
MQQAFLNNEEVVAIRCGVERIRNDSGRRARLEVVNRVLDLIRRDVGQVLFQRQAAREYIERDRANPQRRGRLCTHRHGTHAIDIQVGWIIFHVIHRQLDGEVVLDRCQHPVDRSRLGSLQWSHRTEASEVGQVQAIVEDDLTAAERQWRTIRLYDRPGVLQRLSHVAAVGHLVRFGQLDIRGGDTHRRVDGVDVIDHRLLGVDEYRHGDLYAL